MPKGIAKDGKPNSGAFKKGEAKDDPRRNNAGQRNAAAVEFNKSLRQIIAEVGNEEVKSGTAAYSRVEIMVRGLYVKAAKGDVSAFNALVERVEGRVAQQNQITGAEGGDLIVRVIEKIADAND